MISITTADIFVCSVKFHTQQFEAQSRAKSYRYKEHLCTGEIQTRGGDKMLEEIIRTCLEEDIGFFLQICKEMFKCGKTKAHFCLC